MLSYAPTRLELYLITRSGVKGGEGVQKLALRRESSPPLARRGQGDGSEGKSSPLALWERGWR